MRCAACQTENPPDKKFCGDCGAALGERCPQCGADNPSHKRFCGDCGAQIAPTAVHGAAARREASTSRGVPAGSRTVSRETRKVITVIFADLMGSTALQERLDPESVNRVMDAYYRAVRGPVEAAGGTVVHLLGDGVLCAFGIPQVAEDDALRAVRAAVGIQQAFREFLQAQPWLTVPLGLRVAVNTGEVVVSDEHPAGLGDPLNVAARLQQEARDGEVLIGQATWRLVADTVTLERAGVFVLKGRTETVTAYRVVSLERPSAAATAIFVGRDEELARIAAVYEAAVAKPAASLAVVLGSPGLGKSRLIAETARRLGDTASVVHAQCDAAGGTTFAPLAEALRRWLAGRDSTDGTARTDPFDPAGVHAALESAIPDDADRGRIAAGVMALLAGSPASPEETFFVIRRFLAALAQRKPLVLVIDDLHWAEPLLLDLVEHLIQWGSGVPVLVLVGARPELRDARSSLVTPGGLVADVVTLSGLDAGAATRLAASVIGASDLPAVVAAKVLATSEGNPLFVRELARMLAEEGAIERQGERWVLGANLAALEIPPTIHALLAARIERLRPEERTVLERAAVVGRHFSRSAVAALLGGNDPALDARLEALRRTELIERDTGWFLGEPALRFHHVLIRDAAYRRLLKGTRAELHERVADWIEGQVGDAAEHDETVGWHLEQAHRLLGEVGPLDAGGASLGERAARRLAAAGRRALARDDLVPAASLLGRALDRLGTDDPTRADLVLDWCEALLASGDVGTASRAIAELGGMMADSERLRAWHACFSGQLAVLTDPGALRAAEAEVAAAAETLTAAGDTAGEAKAHSVHALVLAQLGRIGACEAALDRALAAARRVRGDRRLANAVLAGAPLAALWGPSPVTRASGRCLDVVRVLRITQGAPAVEAVALRCQAVLETLRGRGEAARRMIASSRKLVEELGITQRVLEADLFAGLIELLEGDGPAAERWLRSAWDGLRDQGLGIAAAQAGALLARALLALGRVDEAQAVSHESESLAGDSFQAAIAWRGVRAEVLAARGEHAAAIDLARAAVDIAAATDDLLDHADARASLAVALRAAGRGAEADAEERRAIELWEAKGTTLLVERARRVRALEPPVRVSGASAPARRARRMRENAATANEARICAAIAARDSEAFATFFSDTLEVMYHPAGGVLYGREETLRFCRTLIEAPNGMLSSEPLATLGDSLVLARQRISAGGFSGMGFDVGAVQAEVILLAEVDDQGRLRRAENFDPDKLAMAVARLYERHAELLPEGPERTRTAGIARRLPVMLASYDPDALATAMVPTIEYADHRTEGAGALHGVDATREWLRNLVDLAEGVVNRLDEILCLRSDALLFRMTNSGTLRASRGAYERPLLLLLVYGSEGLVERVEVFDPEREADALARFDALTAPSPTPRAVRRVRPNAATASAHRLREAIVARDPSVLPALITDDIEVVYHPTHLAHGAEELLRVWRSYIDARDGTFAVEPLGTLGDSLALCRFSFSASGASGRKFDIGPFESEHLVVYDVDERGRRRHSEVFADDRLDDAIVRLYERHAELLPDGPERVHAAATAGSAAAFLVPRDLDHFTAALAADVERIDHRSLALGTARGAAAVTQQTRAKSELARWRGHTEELLGLRSDALLVHSAYAGTWRLGGGAFETPVLQLVRFGVDGRVVHLEWFDPEQLDAALARFDALTAPAPRITRRVQPNAATATIAATDAAFARRDFDAMVRLFCEAYEEVDHPTGSTYGREEALASVQRLLRSHDPSYRVEPLASLGDRLTLGRRRIHARATGRGRFDVGEYDMETIVLVEVDANGLYRRLEVFAADKLGVAARRLYERYAELLSDGPERARATKAVRWWRAETRVVIALVPEGLADDFEFVDRRTIGFGSLRAPEFQRGVESLLEAAPDSVARCDDLLAVCPDAWLVRTTNSGTDRATGGAFERCFLQLLVFGPDGLISRWEHFDPDREAEALARFDELTTARPAPARRVRANAVMPVAERMNAMIRAGDLEALGLLIAEDAGSVDHTTGLTFDRSEVLAWFRLFGQDRGAALGTEPLATLGDRLMLARSSWTGGSDGGAGDFGPWRVDFLTLTEVGGDGRVAHVETFGPEHLAAAVVRLYERHAELLPDGPERTRAAATARSLPALFGPIDLDRFAAAVAPAVAFADHRTLGFASARGAEALLGVLASLLESAPDATNRIDDVVALRDDAFLVRITNFGTSSLGGGAYERPFLILWTFGADGLVTRSEQFDLGREKEALARFDELARPGRRRRVRPNAATADAARLDAAMAARDADALRAIAAEQADVVSVDHPNGCTYDAEATLASRLAMLNARDLEFGNEPLATLGDGLALFRMSMSASGVAGGSFDVGPYTLQLIVLVDGPGRRGEMFAHDRLGDAIVRLYERHAEILADTPSLGRSGAQATLERDRAATTARSVAALLGSLDPERWAAAIAPDAEFADRRTLEPAVARGAAAGLHGVRSIGDAAADLGARYEDVLALEPHALLVCLTSFGTDRTSGGRFERPFLLLLVFGADGLLKRGEQFDPDREAEALARFDALTAPVPQPHAARGMRPNLATACHARVEAALAARDVDAFVATFAPEAQLVDHPTGNTSGVPEIGRSWRLAFERTPHHRLATEAIATLGEQLVLARWRVRASTSSGGRFDVGEFEYDDVFLSEVDDRGLCRCSERFTADRLRDAVARLYERYAALLPEGPERRRGAGAARTIAAFSSRHSVPTGLAPGLEFVDHRPLGFPASQGSDAFVRLLGTLADETGDSHVFWEDILDLRPSALLVRGTNKGTLRVDAGAFERPFLYLWTFAADGLLARFEVFDPEHAATALARFAELARADDALGATVPPDPLAALVKPNAASAATDRLQAAVTSRDWPAVRALLAEGATCEDRRRHVLVSGDADWWLQDLRNISEIAGGDLRYERTLVATAGDRISLDRVLVVHGPAGGRIEVEILWLAEIDDTGRVVAGIAFDVDDRRAAYRELIERHARSEEGRAMPAELHELRRAFLDRDLERARAALPSDFTVKDHRRTRLWRIEGRDAWVAWMATLFEQSPDAIIAPLHYLAVEEHGCLTIAYGAGTLPEGGAFEQVFLSLFHFRGGRVAELEMFEIEDLDRARARFEALRPDAAAR